MKLVNPLPTKAIRDDECPHTYLAQCEICVTTHYKLNYVIGIVEQAKPLAPKEALLAIIPPDNSVTSLQTSYIGDYTPSATLDEALRTVCDALYLQGADLG